MVPPHGVPLKSDIRSKLDYLILNGGRGIQKMVFNRSCDSESNFQGTVRLTSHEIMLY